jgi:hypothetical protein
VEQEKIVQDLGEQAEQVAAGYDRAGAAYRRRLSASAELLNRVIDAVRPALRAMGSRVEIARTQSAMGVTSDSAAFRGVELWGEAPTGRPVVIQGDGVGFILTDHGDLVIARYVYTGTRDATSWRATYDLVTAAKLVDQVGDDFGQVLDRIAQALKVAARDSSPAAAAAHNAQAARIEAAALLLGVR